jgi:1-acyl-sn-glycerol-3-phosphate acyltransferase
MLRIFLETRKHASQVFAVGEVRTEEDIKAMHAIMMGWARLLLRLLRVEVSVSGAPPSTENVLLIGNHMSYLDILCLMSLSPVVFVAKRELAKWPVIGRACRSVGTVFVERDSKGSRRGAGDAVARHFQERKTNVCIFPSGTTTLDEKKTWRWGGFEIARRYKIPVQPFRITYRPLRKVAFIGDDALLTHLWALLGEKRIEVSLEFEAPVQISDAQGECKMWQEWNRKSLARFDAEHLG